MLVDGPHCTNCIQQPVGQRFVYFNGTTASQIMIVGDSPWVEEVRAGKPFQGPSGRLLDAQLRRAGVKREDVIVTNSMMCKPPYLNWTGKHPDSALAIQHCRPHLDELIERIRPKVILTLGTVAMQRVIGVSGLDNRQSYIHDTVYGIPAVPTYHPSHLLQGNHKLTQCLFFAIQRAVEVSRNNSWQRSAVSYLIDPPVEEARAYLFEDEVSDMREVSDVAVYTKGETRQGLALSEPEELGELIGGGSVANLSEPEGVVCPSCGLGQDMDGDGDCPVCGGRGVVTSNVVTRSDGARLVIEPGGEPRLLSPLEDRARLMELSALVPMDCWATGPLPAGFRPRIPILVIDLETPNSSNLDEESAEDDPSYTIIRVGLSIGPNTAVTLPWAEPYMQLIREAVASAAVVVVWNGDGFDLPRMLHNQITWQGEVHDAMWMWHFLQSDLLKGLGFVAPFYTDLPPWKHLSGADLPYYTCCDADAEMRCYFGIRRDLEQAGRWKRFVRHGIRMARLLRHEPVGRIPLDTTAQASLKLRLQQERAIAMAKLQTQVPPQIRRNKVLKVKPRKDAELYHTIQTPCLCQQAGEPDNNPSNNNPSEQELS